jgi:hypothetical protein
MRERDDESRQKRISVGEKEVVSSSSQLVNVKEPTAARMNLDGGRTSRRVNTVRHSTIQVFVQTVLISSSTDPYSLSYDYRS